MAHTQGERVALKLVGVETANAVAIAYACQIDKVYQRIDLVELLALEDAADEGFGSRTVARRVFAAGAVDLAGGSYARDVFERLGRQGLPELLAQSVYLAPESC